MGNSFFTQAIAAKLDAKNLQWRAGTGQAARDCIDKAKMKVNITAGTSRPSALVRYACPRRFMKKGVEREASLRSPLGASWGRRGSERGIRGSREWSTRPRTVRSPKWAKPGSSRSVPPITGSRPNGLAKQLVPALAFVCIGTRVYVGLKIEPSPFLGGLSFVVVLGWLLWFFMSLEFSVCPFAPVKKARRGNEIERKSVFG